MNAGKIFGRRLDRAVALVQEANFAGNIGFD